MNAYHGKGFTQSRYHGLHTTYRYFYRVLRHDENYKNGLFARYPGANKTVADHIEGGRMFRSQYISTTTSLAAAEYFAVQSRNWPKVVVRINVAQLKTYNIELIDLTNERVLHEYVSTTRKRAIAFAQKNREVLIRDFVPPSCVKFEGLLKYPKFSFMYESDNDYSRRLRFGMRHRYSRQEWNREWKRRKCYYDNVRTQQTQRYSRYSRRSVQVRPFYGERNDAIRYGHTRRTFCELRQTYRQSQPWYSYMR